MSLCIFTPVAKLVPIVRPRSALVGCAVLTALMMAPAAALAGPDLCDTVSIPGTAICQGNQSAGISSGIDFPVPPVTTLDVNSLSQPIAPASGDGIHFLNFAGGDVTINSNTGSFGIITTTGFVGISATSSNAAGSSGPVTVTSTGNITSANDGIDAGSFATVGNASSVTVTSTGNVTGGNFGISAGSLSFSGGTSGAVTVTSTGNITGASGSFGMFVQSNSSDGNAGPVTVTSTGDITGYVTGIDASSISNAVIGNVGAVTVTSIGNISAVGANAFGIRADNGGVGTAGNATVESTGNVSALGADAVGIDVNSFGAASSGNLTVDVLAGTVTGGSGNGAGVQILNGNINTLNNHGTIQAQSGLAITTQGLGGISVGNLAINNFGTITGSIDVPTGNNSFDNKAGATFNSGPTVDLGGGLNTLSNSGNLSPGGVGTVQTSTLTGNLVQTSTGTYTVDVNWTAPSADLVHVVGGTAQLAGTVVVNPINFPTTAGLHQQFTILHTDAPGDITDNGITPVSTAAVSYLLLFPGLQDMVLDATINFTGVGLGGLNPNQTAIGENLNAIQLAGGSPAMSALTTALMTLPTQQSLANALDQLSPEIYNYDLIETLYASQQFANDMMSCRVAGENGAAFIREGQCIWARARARFLELDHTTNNIGAEDTTGSFSAGAQVALAPDWLLGFAAGYDRIQLDTGTGASSDGDRANVGGVLKYNPGPLLLAAGVTAGWGFDDTTRTLAFGGFNAEATSNNDINYVSGQVHAAYLFSQGNWYLKPLVDAGVTELDLNGFTEHGGGGAALIVPGRSDTVFNVSPALEIGTEMRFDNVSVWRPFVRAGATWQDTGSFVLNAGFFDAPQGVSPFAIRTKLDQVLADVGAGVDIINTAGAVLRVQYDGKFAQDTQQNSVSLKGSVPF